MYINTVLGPIAPGQLGPTYCHEHLKLDLSGHKGDPDTRYDDLPGVVDELQGLRRQGLGAVVEVSNWGMGRDIPALVRVAEATGLYVIPSTGVYKEPFLPHWVGERDEGELAAAMVREIRQGIDDTHTTLGRLGMEQVKLFREMGMDLTRVVIGHTDLSDDPEAHLRLAATGCYLGFDTVGKLNYQPDEVRALRIKDLVERGHGQQIVLSQDLTRKSQLRSRGGIGYAYLLESFVPRLLQLGLTRADIDLMLVENPARWLAVEG